MSIVVRPVLQPSDLDEVHRLTHDAYLALGYIDPQPDGRFRHYAAVEYAPENMVLVAADGDAIVGTISATIDGPCGLPVDHDFVPTCDAVRAEGRSVGVVWRMVTTPAHRANIKLALALIGASLEVLERFGTDTVLISPTPHHERAYEHVFGLRPIARTAVTSYVRTALVLMRGSVSEAAGRISRPASWTIATLVAERRRLLTALRSADQLDGNVVRPWRCRCARGAGRGR